MGPLNQQPLGLLDFFQAKSGGRVFPEQASEVLMPTWDLRDHYLSTNAQYTPPASIPFASGNNVQLTVIQPVNWWRWGVNLSLAWVPAAAADAFLGQVLLVSPTNAAEALFPAQPVTPTGAVSYPGGFNFAASAALQRWQYNCSGFWIPPGFSVNLLEVIGVNGGAAILNASYRIANFRQ